MFSSAFFILHIMKALILVDIQNDFLEGGALAVPNANEIIPIVNQIIPTFDLVVATQDWHPTNHKSFASQHENKKTFEQIDLFGLPQTLWPDHCIQNTSGAEFHKYLNTQNVYAIFRKGTNPSIDSYSGFYDNGKRESTGLKGYLNEKGVTDVYVCGLAGDFCVQFTAFDALQAGFKTYMIDSAIKSISPSNFEAIKKEFIAQGGNII